MNPASPAPDEARDGTAPRPPDGPCPAAEGLPNRLLAALPPAEREHVVAGCEAVGLTFADLLAEAGEPLEHVYFPTGSFIAEITVIDGKAMLEVGMIGNEGVLGASLLLGLEVSPLRAVVHGPGPALRMERPRFVYELGRNPALQGLLQRYLYVEMQQLARNAACNRFHRVEERLARWLLMTHDRAHAVHFQITHELLARMLGVRRVGVTQAAGALQKRELIRYARGRVTILDRSGLEAASCSCYEADRAAWARLLPGNLEV